MQETEQRSRTRQDKTTFQASIHAHRKTNKSPKTLHPLSRVEDLEELLSSDGRSRLLGGALGLSLLSQELLSSEGLGVWVESEENSLVSEGVLLLGEGS